MPVKTERTESVNVCPGTPREVTAETSFKNPPPPDGRRQRQVVVVSERLPERLAVRSGMCLLNWSSTLPEVLARRFLIPNSQFLFLNTCQSGIAGPQHSGFGQPPGSRGDVPRSSATAWGTVARRASTSSSPSTAAVPRVSRWACAPSGLATAPGRGFSRRRPPPPGGSCGVCTG